jgi:large subunit ribosomal protein L29
MKVKDIREMTTEELNVKLFDLKKELYNLRFRNATNQLENPLEIANVKKSIARVKTVIRERELKETV